MLSSKSCSGPLNLLCTAWNFGNSRSDCTNKDWETSGMPTKSNIHNHWACNGSLQIIHVGGNILEKNPIKIKYNVKKINMI